MTAESNLVMFDWQVDLDERGAANVLGKTQFKGALATEMRQALVYASPDDQRHWLETYLASRCPGVKLDSFYVAGIEPVEDPLTINYNFYTATFALSQNDRMAFHPAQVLFFNLPDFFRSFEREHPIRFRCGVTEMLKMKIDLPANWHLSTPAWFDSLDSSFGSANWAYACNGDTLKVYVNRQLNGTEVYPKQYQDFQDFLDKIKARDLREIVLTRSE